MRRRYPIRRRSLRGKTSSSCGASRSGRCSISLRRSSTRSRQNTIFSSHTKTAGRPSAFPPPCCVETPCAALERTQVVRHQLASATAAVAVAAAAIVALHLGVARAVLVVTLGAVAATLFVAGYLAARTATLGSVLVVVALSSNFLPALAAVVVVASDLLFAFGVGVVALASDLLGVARLGVIFICRSGEPGVRRLYRLGGLAGLRHLARLCLCRLLRDGRRLGHRRDDLCRLGDNAILIPGRLTGRLLRAARLRRVEIGTALRREATEG